jgi:hypothetical protein
MDSFKGPENLKKIVDSYIEKLSEEYYNMIPDKNASTYHTWYDHMPKNIRDKVKQIQKSDFWNKICDGSEKCMKISANEMDELYYSNPQNNIDKINLYGASGNYDIHKDCFYNFDGIKFYRVIIGLTDGNNNIITYFNNLDVGHKINFGDYIVFDFDKSIHQVIKDKQELTPRILLKLHYIVCENCNYSKKNVEQIVLEVDNSDNIIQETTSDKKPKKKVNAIKYADKKRLAILHAQYFLEKNPNYIEFFNNHKKKDDLADSFLQGLYYIKNIKEPKK